MTSDGSCKSRFIWQVMADIYQDCLYDKIYMTSDGLYIYQDL